LGWFQSAKARPNLILTQAGLALKICKLDDVLASVEPKQRGSQDWKFADCPRALELRRHRAAEYLGRPHAIVPVRVRLEQAPIVLSADERAWVARERDNGQCPKDGVDGTALEAELA
jgi:hypothetical protein